jgi:hypothetical protein
VKKCANIENVPNFILRSRATGKFSSKTYPNNNFSTFQLSLAIYSSMSINSAQQVKEWETKKCSEFHPRGGQPGNFNEKYPCTITFHLFNWLSQCTERIDYILSSTSGRLRNMIDVPYFILRKQPGILMKIIPCNNFLDFNRLTDFRKQYIYRFGSTIGRTWKHQIDSNLFLWEQPGNLILKLPQQ